MHRRAIADSAADGLQLVRVPSSSTTIARTASVLLAGIAGLAFVPVAARAHVDYVTPGGPARDPIEFLRATLTEPANAAILAGAAALVVAASVGYLLLRPFRRDLAVFRATLVGYSDLLPWLLRLAVGLPFVGAGFGGYLFAPGVEPAALGLTAPQVRLAGVAIGFCLLFGLATRAVASVALLGYLATAVVAPRTFLALEFVPGLLAVVLVGAGRPSADHVLSELAAAETAYARVDPVYRLVAVPFAERVASFRPHVPTVLRAGLGVAFLYLGVTQKLLAPGASLAVVEKYDLVAVVPVDPALWVVGAGLAEAALGLALLAGAFTRAAATAAFLLMTATLFGLPDDPVLAHVSLFGLVSALLITGAGPLSLDAAIGSSATVADRRDSGSTVEDAEAEADAATTAD